MSTILPAEAAITHPAAENSKRSRPLAILPWLAAGSFHLAFQMPALAPLLFIYAFAMIALSRTSSPRAAFHLGVLTGLLIFGPQLAWFWRIFGPASVCLWLILSSFHGFFASGLQSFRARYGLKWLWLAAPILWCGLEYFRSELYFLRFSWLSAGYAFPHPGYLPIGTLGVYGTGFAVFLVVSWCARDALRKASLKLALVILLTATCQHLPRHDAKRASDTVLPVAGIQLEFPADLEIPRYLDQLLSAYPSAELLVLSEYTFDGEVPPRALAWCRNHRKYLVAGGKRAGENQSDFYNTAFVIGPEGTVVFEQAKSVPIQFFKDGLPASTQKLWESPWGRIGICVCYDLSYRNVADQLALRGAQALIVPFMDVTEWGERQHQLHARIGPMRAQEYQIPIFRLGSSGISQVIDRDGQVVSQTLFPGQEEKIFGALRLSSEARLPLDRYLAPACTLLSGILLGFLLLDRLRQRRA